MCILGTDFVKSNALIVQYNGNTIQFAKLLGQHNVESEKSVTFGIDRFDINDIEVSQDTITNEFDKLNIGDDQMAFEHIAKVKSLFTNNYYDAFKPIEAEHKYIMKIDLIENKPFNFSARRLSHIQKLEVEKQIEKLLADGVITESNSPYASRIVLVKKKDNSWRMCVDYRELNKMTVKDRYPLPLIEDHLDTLRNKNYFTSLDLKSGYHHLYIDENCQKCTSFITHLRQF